MNENKKRAYKGIESRSFKTAIIQLLEREYKILGSHKVIKMIADDIDQLHRKFYPSTESRCIGEIRWVTTSVGNDKPVLGQKAGEYKLTTVNLPYLTKEDIKLKKEGISSDDHDLLRLERLTKSAWSQGGVLSQGELAAILNRSLVTISRRLRDYQERNREVLPLKGYVFDIGRATTHKGIIIKLYEKGVAPPDIARRTYHNLRAVDKYIKDYDRIKFLIRRGLSRDEITRAIGRCKSLMEEYIEILKKYHPEMLKNNQNHEDK